MKLIATIILSMTATICVAEDVLPVFPAELVEENHRLVDFELGDLNGDSIVDIILITRDIDTKNITIYEKMIFSDGRNYTQWRDDNLYVISVYLAMPNGGYSLKARSDSFIPLAGRNEDEIYGYTNITNGKLIVSLHFWSSAGSWQTGNRNYMFRLKEDDFQLIGIESQFFHRASGESESESINLLTGDAILTLGTEMGDTITSTQKGKVMGNYSQYFLNNLDYADIELNIEY